MHVPLETARAVAMQVQDYVFHILHLIERKFEGDEVFLILEYLLIFLGRYEKFFVVEEPRRTDQHITEHFLDTRRLVLFDSIDERWAIHLLATVL